MPTVAIVAGDASGDLYGSKLLFEIRRLMPETDFWAAGGPHLKNAGAEIVADFSSVSAIGVVQSLKVVPFLWLSFIRILRTRIKKDKTDVLILIDFGAFNRRLGPKARKAGIRTIYFIPPGSWRKIGSIDAKTIKSADLFLTPFQWSAQKLSEAGASANYIGHPLLDIVKTTVQTEQFKKEIGLPSDAQYIALLPGSRKAEIENILPTLLDAAGIINSLQPDLHFLIAAAPSVSKLISKKLNNWRRGWREKIPVQVVENRANDVLAGALAAAVTSGTATLEAAILEVPMVIVYRGTILMHLEKFFRSRVLGKYIGLPNILVDDKVCEELIGKEATSEAVAAEIVRLIRNEKLRNNMKTRFQEVKSLLGEPGALQRAAKLIVEFAELSNKY